MAKHRARFFIWIISSLYVLLQFMLQTSPSVMMIPLQKSFQVGIGFFSLLSSSFFYTYLLAQIPSGLLLDRFGVRRVLIGCLMLCVIVTGAFSFANTVQVAIVSRVLMGLVAAPSVAAAMYLANQWFLPARFALFAGLTEMMGMLGGALGESTLAIGVVHFGWRATLWLVLLATVVVLGLVMVFVKQDHTSAVARPHSKSNTMMMGLKQIASMPQMWLSGLVIGLIFPVITTFAGLWAIPFLHVVYHLSLEQAAFASSILFIGAAIGGPLLGWLVGCIGYRKQILAINVAMTLVIMVWLLQAHAHNPLLLVSLFLLGFGAGSYALPFAIIRDLAPAGTHGTALGFANMLCIGIGSPLLQPLVAYLLVFFSPIGQFGQAIISVKSYHEALWVLPILLMLALVLLPFIKDPCVSTPANTA